MQIELLHPHPIKNTLSSGPHIFVAGESFVRGEHGEGGQEKGSVCPHNTRFVFPCLSWKTTLHLYWSIKGLGIWKWHTSNDYWATVHMKGIQNTSQIILYLNYFRFQSINKSASFDTKSLWLRLFIPTFMLCLLITLKSLFFFFFFLHRKAKKQSLKDIYIILYITSSFWEMRILKFQKYSHSKW